jgi:hypothetical protein
VASLATQKIVRTMRAWLRRRERWQGSSGNADVAPAMRTAARPKLCSF